MLALDPGASDPFATPKSVAWHTAAASSGVAALVAYATRPPRFRALHAALLIFSLVTLLATAVAAHPPTAIAGAMRRWLGAISVFEGIGLALAVSAFVTSARQLGLVCAATGVAMIAALGYGALQMAGLDPVDWGFSGRTTSTFGNNATYAGFLSMAIPASVLLFGDLWKQLGRPWQAGAAIALLLAAAEMVSSGSRWPLVSAGLGTLLAGALVARRHGFGLREGVLGTAALLGSLVALVLLPTGLAGRFATLLTGADGSLLERRIIYEAALEAVRTRPWLGVGPDSLVAVYTAVRPDGAVHLPVLPLQTSTHSWLLHEAVGAGVLGVAAFTAIAAFAIRDVLGTIRRGSGHAIRHELALVLLVTFLIQGALNPNALALQWVFWVGVGLALPPLALPESPRTRRPRDWAAFVVLLIAAILLSLAVRPWLASRLSHESSAARRAGALAHAEAAARAAVSLDGRADNWNVLGLSRRNDPGRAMEAFAAAAAAAPFDPLYRINAAKEALRAEPANSYLSLARRHAEAAIAQEPENWEAHFVLAHALWRSGDRAGAAHEADAALRYADPRPEALFRAYALLGALHAEGRALAAAEDALRLGIESALRAGDLAIWDLRVDLARVLLMRGDVWAARELAAMIKREVPAHAAIPALFQEIERRGAQP